MSSFLKVIKRDLTSAYRNRIELLTPLVFFILICTLFPLTITSDPQKLMLMGPGIIWIALLFAILLNLEKLFQNDFEDGSLEELVLSSDPLPLLIMAKLFTHWLIIVIPLLIAIFFLSQLFFLSKHTVAILSFSILLGSPVLINMGALGAALTLGLGNRGMLLILLILPLYLPVLIFGASAGLNATFHLPVESQLAFLAAILTITMTFLPFAISGAIRIILE